MKRRLAPNQWQVLMCIFRKTNGFHKEVDYIANSQIIEDTELCKTVVSRVLTELEAMNIIIRNGKNIGIQKDWILWEKLAKQSTKVSNIANFDDEKEKLAELSTSEPEHGEKLAEQLTNEKLAIQSTELAELSTGVSNLVNSVSRTANKKLAKLLTTKESKETITKKTITKETKQKKDAPPKKKYGEFQNVLLTDEEYRKLLERFGEIDASKRIESLSSYMASRRKKYDSHYATILNWARRDERESLNNPPKFRPVPKPGAAPPISGHDEVEQRERDLIQQRAAAWRQS
jgi:phage replication O-like protein O